jgi:hypothetical protein
MSWATQRSGERSSATRLSLRWWLSRADLHWYRVVHGLSQPIVDTSHPPQTQPDQRGWTPECVVKLCSPSRSNDRLSIFRNADSPSCVGGVGRSSTRLLPGASTSDCGREFGVH